VEVSFGEPIPPDEATTQAVESALHTLRESALERRA
jgi:hypothetical protein